VRKVNLQCIAIANDIGGEVVGFHTGCVDAEPLRQGLVGRLGRFPQELRGFVWYADLWQRAHFLLFEAFFSHELGGWGFLHGEINGLRCAGKRHGCRIVV
jgi:hypothetical protein